MHPKELTLKYLIKAPSCGELQRHTVSESYRDKTTINFQYIYHIAFWLLENSTILLAPNE